jgi:RNA polymerase sigma-70 factor, ECF subfamily
LTFFSFDDAYIARLRDGDRATEEHFAGYFGDLLYLKLRTRLRSPQLVEDVRQETLLRVLQTLRRKGGVEHPERFGAFVNAVCNNVMLEQFRAERNHDPIGEDHDEPVDRRVDLNRDLIDHDRKRQVERVLAEMPVKDRELLRELLLEEKDKSEVCARLAVDPDYLRVLLHRAKSRFRKIYLSRGAAAVGSREHVAGP